MLGEVDEFGRDGGAIGLYKGEVAAAAGLEAEVGVRWDCGEVFSRSEDASVAPTGKFQDRELPHGEVGGVIGEIPAAEVAADARGVLDLDPV